METVLKFDEVILVKELNDRYKKVGDTFEVASILEYGYLLRESKSKVAVGVVSFDHFEKYFVKADEFKGWTPWIKIVGFDGQNDAYYRTNKRKTQVKFLTDKVRAEACRNKMNEFNLGFGIQMAYLRCFNKALEKKKAELEAEIKKINCEISDNESIIKNMMKSLDK